MKTSGLFLLWADAAISLAEIMTGSLIGPLGLGKGIAVIIIGHVIGCLILAATGLIGYQKKTSALQSSRFAFGRFGSYLISILNIVQLIGWTSVMLIQCSSSVSAIFDQKSSSVFILTVIGLGILVAVWVLFASKGFQHINNIAVILLVALSLVILIMMIHNHQGALTKVAGPLSFGAALEFSIAMPLSWLPLISDYTMNAKSGKGAFWGSLIGYFAGSAFMYFIGLAASLFTNAADFTGVLVQLGVGVVGLVVVVLATVTTTYLDVYSAAMSVLNIAPKLSKQLLIILVSGVGTVVAIFFPMDHYQTFLYAIDSVFAPVFAVVLTDYFLLKGDHSHSVLNWRALVSAAVGTAVYYVFIQLDLPIGSTIPSMIIAFVLYLVLHALFERKPKALTE